MGDGEENKPNENFGDSVIKEDSNNGNDGSNLTNSSNEAVPEQEQTPKKKRFYKNITKKHVLIVAGLVFLVVASSGITYALTRKSVNNEITTKQSDSVGKEKAMAVEEQTETQIKDIKFAWQAPKPVSALPIYEDLDGYYSNTYTDGDGSSYSAQHEYYIVGQSDDGTKAYITTAPATIDGSLVVFLTEKNGKYTIYNQHSGEGVFYATEDGKPAAYQGPKLNSNTTTIDYSTVISEIENKKEVTFNGQKLTTAGGFSGGLDFQKEAEPPLYDGKSGSLFLADIPEGKLYERTSNSDPSYKISNYLVVYRNNTTASFVVDGELSKAEIDPITWSDGSRNSDDYASVGRGCGLSGANEIAIGVTREQLVVLGKSDGGQEVYGFKEPSTLLVGKHYEEYNQGNNPDYSFYSAEDSNLSLDAFVSRRPIYLIEDGNGRWLVFSNLRYVPQGGCAKPVVYLYPELPMSVDVSVDADVTISDPLYEKDGWQNVLAMPGGLLQYRGKNYDSLFWEGYSDGVYPEVKSGTVVKRSEIVSTWRKHLKQFNLNDREINDFVEFWETRIPNKPYARISWLGTESMQRLAPLYVSGGVDTMIRVFMDMEGLDTYQIIPEQNLVGVNREGFTVVEWGGLVNDGSIPKLQ
jgi:hypothetical protein